MTIQIDDLTACTDLTEYGEKYRESAAATIAEYRLRSDRRYRLDFEWAETNPEYRELESATLVAFEGTTEVDRIEITLTEGGQLPGTLADTLHETGDPENLLNDLLDEDADLAFGNVGGW